MKTLFILFLAVIVWADTSDYAWYLDSSYYDDPSISRCVSEPWVAPDCGKSRGEILRNDSLFSRHFVIWTASMQNEPLSREKYCVYFKLFIASPTRNSFFFTEKDRALNPKNPEITHLQIFATDTTAKYVFPDTTLIKESLFKSGNTHQITFMSNDKYNWNMYLDGEVIEVIKCKYPYGFTLNFYSDSINIISGFRTYYHPITEDDVLMLNGIKLTSVFRLPHSLYLPFHNAKFDYMGRANIHQLGRLYEPYLRRNRITTYTK